MAAKAKKVQTVSIPEFKPEEMPMSCTWIIIGPPATGKCLAPDTLVMMHNGMSKKVQDIITGDKLMGDDFEPRNVLSITSGEDEMYEIQQSHGMNYTVNGAHILCLKYMMHPCIVLKNGKYHPDHAKDNRYYVEYMKDNRFVSQACVSYEVAESMIRKMKVDVDYTVENIVEISVDDYLRLSNDSRIRSYYGYKTPLKDGFRRTNEMLSNITIVPKGKGPYYGFEIDGNGRFLLEDRTVTHNTTLMENFAYYRKHLYPVAKCFIATEDGYKRFSKIFHPLFVSNYWDEKDEERHVLRQRTCEMENGRGYPGNYAINIIDDVSDDPKIYKTKLMRGLFKLGSQHWAQLLMVGSQYAIDMPPDVRKSVSYVAIGREPEPNERRKLYDNFGGLAGSYERFCDLMDQITGDHTFLIFKKRSQSNELEDCVSWFQTKPMNDWKFGSKEYRKWGEDRYDKNYKEQIIM